MIVRSRRAQRASGWQLRAELAALDAYDRLPTPESVSYSAIPPPCPWAGENSAAAERSVEARFEQLPKLNPDDVW